MANLEVRDLAPECCREYNVAVRNDRPCLMLKNVITPGECNEILEFANAKHDSEAKDLDIGSQSEFSHFDVDLSARIWEKLRHHLPSELYCGNCIGLRAEWHHARYIKPIRIVI